MKCKSSSEKDIDDKNILNSYLFEKIEANLTISNVSMLPEARKFLIRVDVLIYKSPFCRFGQC